ncbi:MAG: hypothetical protein JJ866_15880 [Roseibium sp.]|uniref:hypothetical protein n=1 Tax=Roseibium sp. TaxID=1936156 RepID=UPI001B0AC0D9|nr:hypothetical protein [Roseibium sp.]MBO6893423.1 hypothetical protein [Roseibium sp.]MBO6930610.1 hypothetical protein [Roseibium sp.]
MSDLWGALDPDRFLLLALLVCGLVTLLFGFTVALMIWALGGLKAGAEADLKSLDPDPFCAPGSHEGLRVGPITTRARLSETSQPGTPQ